MLHLLHLHDRAENGTGDKIANTGGDPTLLLAFGGGGWNGGDGGGGGGGGGRVV